MEPFQLLEEKLTRVVEVYRRTQLENRALLAEIEKLRTDSKQGAQHKEALDRELQSLRREREEVRARVERLLQQVDALTKQDAAGAS